MPSAQCQRPEATDTVPLPLKNVLHVRQNCRAYIPDDNEGNTHSTKAGRYSLLQPRSSSYKRSTAKWQKTAEQPGTVELNLPCIWLPD